VSGTLRFGRDDEIAEVQRRLADVRQVTVTGAPGVGKSRLVAEVAAVWPAEVVHCALGGLRTAAAAAEAVARRLELGMGPGPPPIAEALAGRPGVLLVLDDAEEIELLGDLVDGWLLPHPGAAAPRIVASSRRRLGRAGEHVIDLAPLPREFAIALFVDRARAAGAAVDPADPAVERLVDALDRLPLALELAAARVRLFPPSVWLDRLPALSRGGPEGRHGSLQAALDASRQLLGPEAQLALDRATRLRGPFDVAAFEAVTGAGPEVLEELLDASWVGVEAHGRLRLLRSVRRHAEAHLTETSRADADARHARWVVAEAEAALAAAPRRGWGPVDALRDDLRAAAGASDRELAARAALALSELVVTVGPLDEAVARVPDAPLTLRPRLELLRARILRCQRRFGSALALVDAVLLDAPAGLVPQCETERAICLLGQGDVGGAREALRRRAAAGDGTWEAQLVEAMVLSREGRPQEAIAVLEAALGADPDLDPRGRARMHASLGVYLRATGQLERAVASLHRAAASHQDERLEGMVMAWLATVLRDLGHNEAAAEAAEGAALRCARAGDRGFEFDALMQLGMIRIEEGALDEARRILARCRARPAAAREHGLTEALAASLEHRAGNLPAAVSGYRAALGLLADAGVREGEVELRAELAVAMAASDPVGARAILEEARQHASSDVELVELRVAAEALEGSVSAAAVAEAGALRSAGLRLLVALTRPAPRVARDGAGFETPSGERVDLGRRRVLRRVLAALANAPEALTLSEVLEAGWPGEVLVPASAASRVHVAISSLRRMGLGEALLTEERDGEVAYRLGPDVRLVETFRRD
jgi:predicted ATPase/Tfp pilus assembly protein PilF